MSGIGGVGGSGWTGSKSNPPTLHPEPGVRCGPPGRGRSAHHRRKGGEFPFAL